MHQGFQKFKSSEIGKVPAGPGLYSWYGIVSAGRADWEISVQDGQDVGEHNSRSFLKNHTARYEGESLEIQAKAGFSIAWSGHLRDRSSDDLSAVLEVPSQIEEPAAPKLQTTLRSPQMRETLFGVLQAATPVLASPLYIGVAKNLQSRISQHAEQLSWLWGRVSRDRSFLENATEDPKMKNTFAYRAISRGFSSDSVEVWVLEVEAFSAGNLSNEELRVVAEACEWLLNRWHRPMLGRR